MSLLSFSQNLSEKKNNISDTLITKAFVSDSLYDQNDSIKSNDVLGSYGYGMLINESDTFAVVHVEFIKVANGIFIERNYYKEVTDSLSSIDIVKQGKIDDLENQLFERTNEKDKYINISDLYKEEADDCEMKYKKLVRKHKRAVNGNKIFGTSTGILAIVLLILLL